MSILNHVSIQARNYNSAYEIDFDDLVWGRRAGHMGHHEYRDSSIVLWDEFIQKNLKYYYIPSSETALILKASKITAAMIGHEPVTLISRGCGTKFLSKEGALIKELRNLKGVVYLDRCNLALEQSMAEGKQLIPDAWHKSIQCDLYDNTLRYDVEGIEINTMFGMTSMNIEGFHDAQTPHDIYCNNLRSMRGQMRNGAHFITTFDHNQNRASIERAYCGQEDFAKQMLHDTGSINPDHIDFIVRFFADSKILAHGFRFKKNTDVYSRSGMRSFSTGDILWFNNSVKPEKKQIQSWNCESGFTYLRQDILMDQKRRIGWHHLIK